LNLIAGKERGTKLESYISNHGVNLSSTGELDLV
jgi:hypothetical protein